MECQNGTRDTHMSNECLKLNGVLEWYKRYTENRMSPRANIIDNEEDTLSSHGGVE